MCWFWLGDVGLWLCFGLCVSGGVGLGLGGELGVCLFCMLDGGSHCLFVVFVLHGLFDGLGVVVCCD